MQSRRGARNSLCAVCCQLPQSFFIPQDCKPIHGWVSILLSQDPVWSRLLVMLLLRGSLGLFLAEMRVACFPAGDQLQKQHQTKRVFSEQGLCLPCSFQRKLFGRREEVVKSCLLYWKFKSLVYTNKRKWLSGMSTWL